MFDFLFGNIQLDFSHLRTEMHTLKTILSLHLLVCIFPTLRLLQYNIKILNLLVYLKHFTPEGFFYVNSYEYFNYAFLHI